MDHYARKRILIILVFLAIIVIIAGVIYLLTNKTQVATCFDGIKNQGEDSIDCGGPCEKCSEIKQPLEILSIIYIPTTNNTYDPTANNYYDLVARVKNPNTKSGVESTDYIFNLYDSNNNLIYSKQGKTYILPQESKYIVEQKIPINQTPARIELKLENTMWVLLKNFSELNLSIKNRNHYINSQGYNEISGSVENKSNYNLDTIEVVGLLFDESGKIIAAGKTEMNTVVMNESRGFNIIWPYQLSKNASDFDVRIYTDVFSNENFLKAQGSQNFEQE